ncbi:NAD(P)-dependent oxidoreductase [Ferroacidibacillus organovorans]|uniref:3-hydroxyisobutyrate dehydrogenase n=1 Tax=Ferroacidibacillus organovorans TaxID=1765683 RepID=A0A101XR28_9BACL|nr:NAD(P)-dependent oxidoreductase [Ferroacidibacillus organovorans]KUO95969.1 hypothetical protein ATW55_02510 [Ferroacidibacillus organovorans]
MRIGWIGTGAMGLPMLGHLLAQEGIEAQVYNRTRANAQRAVDAGARFCASPRAVAQDVDVLFLMLSNEQAVHDVLFGNDSASAGLKQGSIVVDASTISPDASLQHAERLQDLGVFHLDTPVSGSTPHAAARTLTFMVGGPEVAFSRVLPLLERMGKTIVHVGDHSSGLHAKLAINTVLTLNLLSMIEGLALARAAGVDTQKWMELLAGSAARSGVMEYKGPKLVNRDFSPQFTANLLAKDVQLAIELARRAGLPLPVLASAQQVLQMARAQGWGAEDMIAIAKVYEQWSLDDQQ